MQTLKRYAPALLFVLLAFAVMPWLAGPRCPKRLVIATGSREGAYYAFAQRYAEILARDGVTLDLRCTAGSVENASLLMDDSQDVSLAVIQGGVAAGAAENEVESIASLYLEPVWVFYRGDPTLDCLTDLHGKRIAVGEVASGTRSLAALLLEENGVGTMDDGRTLLFDMGGWSAAQALQTGEVDAAFFVISPQSPIVHQLMQDDEIHLLSFRHAAAYKHRHPFLSSVTLAEGILNLQSNTPSRDIVLLAPAANLVARNEMHEALVPLILEAATEVHRRGGLLEEKGAFPNVQFVDGAVNADAQRYFKSGPPLFYRVLPFRLAVWLDRVKFVALPLLTLLLPLLKAAPPIYRWRIRSKIYRWYRVLREVDVKLKASDAGTDFGPDILMLQDLDDELSEVSVPLAYMEEFYNLRLHVAYLLDRAMTRQRKLEVIPRRRAA